MTKNSPEREHLTNKQLWAMKAKWSSKLEKFSILKQTKTWLERGCNKYF